MQMIHIKKILIVLLSIFCGMSFAQLLDTQPKRKKINFWESHYEQAPNLKYYDNLLKKEKGKHLYDLAQESYYAMDSERAYTLSGRELHAINLAMQKHSNSLDKGQYFKSIYIYKINSELLYIYIDLNENEYLMEEKGGFYNSSKKQPIGGRFGGGGGEYLFNLKTMTLVERVCCEK